MSQYHTFTAHDAVAYAQQDVYKRQLQRCLDFVTDNSARALCLGDNYGLAEGLSLIHI